MRVRTRTRSRSCILDISSKRPRLRRRARSRTLGPHSHEPLFHLCNPSARASSHTSSPTRIENRSIAKSPRLPGFSPLAKHSFIRANRRPQYAFYLPIFPRKMSLRALYQIEHIRRPFPKSIYVSLGNYQSQPLIKRDKQLSLILIYARFEYARLYTFRSDPKSF